MLTKKLLKNYLYEIIPFCNRNSITVILSFGGGYYQSLNICLESIFNRKLNDDKLSPRPIILNCVLCPLLLPWEISAHSGVHQKRLQKLIPSDYR